MVSPLVHGDVACHSWYSESCWPPPPFSDVVAIVGHLVHSTQPPPDVSEPLHSRRFDVSPAHPNSGQ
jgi:hypothetical protein